MAPYVKTYFVLIKNMDDVQAVFTPATTQNYSYTAVTKGKSWCLIFFKAASSICRTRSRDMEK